MIQLSVIVTAYNREKYIKRCISSLLTQDIPSDNYEIVIIDDGSTDQTGNIVDEIAGENKQIKVVHVENSGVADARNLGLENAKGSYITYVDSDDFVEPNAYKEILDIALSGDYDIVMYDLYKTYEHDKVYEEVSLELKEGEISGKEYILCTPSPCNKLMKRSLFAEGNIRFPTGIYYEDYATIPLLANVAKSYYYVKRAVINYYQENESITRVVGFQKKWWDMYKASVNLNKLDKRYEEELEYLIYLYFLVRTSIWYLEVEQFEQLEKIADYMQERFPNWRRNKYIKKRSRKEKITAYLLFKKKGKYIKAFQNLKRKKLC